MVVSFEVLGGAIGAIHSSGFVRRPGMEKAHYERDVAYGLLDGALGLRLRHLDDGDESVETVVVATLPTAAPPSSLSELDDRLAARFQAHPFAVWVPSSVALVEDALRFAEPLAVARIAVTYLCLEGAAQALGRALDERLGRENRSELAHLARCASVAAFGSLTWMGRERRLTPGLPWSHLIGERPLSSSTSTTGLTGALAYDAGVRARLHWLAASVKRALEEDPAALRSRFLPDLPETPLLPAEARGILEGRLRRLAPAELAEQLRANMVRFGDALYGYDRWDAWLALVGEPLDVVAPVLRPVLASTGEADASELMGALLLLGSTDMDPHDASERRTYRARLSAMHSEELAEDHRLFLEMQREVAARYPVTPPERETPRQLRWIARLLIALILVIAYLLAWR